MGKHLGLKAFVLLVVIFFHSFVLVPKIYAGTVVDMAAARTVLRAVAPTAVLATPAGWGYWVGVAVQAGIMYYAIKSAGVTTTKNWINANSPFTDAIATHTYAGPAYNAGGQRWIIGGTQGHALFWATNENPDCWYKYLGYNTSYQGIAYTDTDARNWMGWSTSPPPPPSVPTDYLTELTNSPISYNQGDIWYTPGGAGQLAATNGGGTVVSVQQKPDSELDSLKSALGMTSPDASTGVQPNPTTGDNTMTSGEQQSIPLLQQMLNYLTNLLGIKTDTGNIKLNTDNLVIGQGAQTTAVQQSLGKLDNVAIATQSMKNTMDNVGVAISNQTEAIQQIPDKLDNVVESVESLKTTTETESTLSSRLTGVKTLLLTKFPFSIVAAVTSPGSVTGGTYSIPDLQFPMGQVVSVDPMENAEIASWVAWLRGLMAVGMWAIFVLVMVRRVTEI